MPGALLCLLMALALEAPACGARGAAGDSDALRAGRRGEPQPRVVITHSSGLKAHPRLPGCHTLVPQASPVKHCPGCAGLRERGDLSLGTCVTARLTLM